MNASSLLVAIGRALDDVKLEVVLIGNAAAAIHGSSVTTEDFDFMFRPTPANIRKIKQVADLLGGSMNRPYYPLSDMYRIKNRSEGLQVDFLGSVHGVKSFESMRSRAVPIYVGRSIHIRVADLRDVIASKRAAKRPKDLAVLPVLEDTLKIIVERGGTS